MSSISPCHEANYLLALSIISGGILGSEVPVRRISFSVSLGQSLELIRLVNDCDLGHDTVTDFQKEIDWLT